MMKSIELEKTQHTPYVYCDAEKGVLKLLGRSLPEDSNLFYSPILEWLSNFKERDYPSLEAMFYLDYFNTSSAKSLFSVMTLLNEMMLDGKQVVMNWHYDSDDDDMKDLGQEHADLFPNLIQLVEENE